MLSWGEHELWKGVWLSMKCAANEHSCIHLRAHAGTAMTVFLLTSFLLYKESASDLKAPPFIEPRFRLRYFGGWRFLTQWEKPFSWNFLSEYWLAWASFWLMQKTHIDISLGLLHTAQFLLSVLINRLAFSIRNWELQLRKIVHTESFYFCFDDCAGDFYQWPVSRACDWRCD